MTDALASLHGSIKTDNRRQTVLTPAYILDAVRVVFRGRIQYDPCGASGSLVDAAATNQINWSDIRDGIFTRASIVAPEHAQTIVGILAGDIRGKAAPPAAVRGAAAVRKQLAIDFASASGHTQEWPDGTFVNPGYGDSGPECLLAPFRSFCRTFAACPNEVIMLGPVRPNRKWWRADVLLGAHAICYLDPVTFHEWPAAFPAPLCAAYRGARVTAFRDAFAHLGTTVKSLRI